LKIILPGGTGQIGVILSRHFLKSGHEIVILSRSPDSESYSPDHPFSHSDVSMLRWDAKQVGDWVSAIEGSDVVINLAGRSVNCRYTPANRKLILDSRVDSTVAIGQAIAQCSAPPKVWLQSSTATIYAHRFDASNDETTGIIGGDEPNVDDTWRFSIDVAKAWEAAAEKFKTDSTRQVLLRSSMVMSPDQDGVFDVLCGLANKGLGGRNGDGKQFVSWIHEADFCGCIDHLISDETLSGPVNVASPNPLPNAEFMEALRQAMGVKFGLPAAQWMLEIGAVLMKTETELLLKSRRVVPGRLLEAGYQFKFPNWNAACRDLASNKSSSVTKL
jgi:uncharacterized protein (TIGR01777 family)